MPYTWWNKIDEFKFDSKDFPEHPLVDEAFKIPEIDLIIKAGSQKNYQFFGAYFTPPQQPSIYLFNFSPGNNFNFEVMTLAKLLKFRANYKQSLNDMTGAENDLLAAFKIGLQLQRGAELMDFMEGGLIEKRIAKEMPAFYRNSNNEDKAQKWEDIISDLNKREIARKLVSNYYKSANVEDIKKMIINDNLPKFLRVEGLTTLVTKSFKASRISLLVGVPKDIGQFIDYQNLNDPELQIVQQELRKCLDQGSLSTFGGKYVARTLPW